jgi:uncharacterized sodium:solute symporter family permease YidK
LIYYFSPYLIHLIDETAETLTLGQMQKFTFVIAGMFVLDGLVWLIIALNFPSIFNAYRSNYNKHAQKSELTPWEQRKYMLALLAIYYLSACILALTAAL